MRDFGAGLKEVSGNEGEKCHYTKRLDTYGCGCQHDCSYCYAKSLLSFRGLWDPRNPSVASLSALSAQIRKLKRGDVVRLGGMTDCFQPLEKIHRMTYKAIRLLNRRGIEYLIVTKSAMVADDEYLRILDPELAHIQITVTTLDDSFCATYEKASPPSQRLRAFYLLQERGYDVQLRFSPYMPEFFNTAQIAGLRAQKICVEFLRVNTWIEKWFDIDYSEYTVKQGGYRHLPLKNKIEYMRRIEAEEITVCEDEDEAYLYWRENVNHNKNDCCNLRRRGT